MNFVKTLIVIAVILSLIPMLYVKTKFFDQKNIVPTGNIPAVPIRVEVKTTVSKAKDSFSVSSFGFDRTIQETKNMNSSLSSDWWVSSGSYFSVKNGIGETSHGSLPELDPWRLLYSKTNPEDTDNGYHPQNIFRLVNRSDWQNYTQSVYFRIDNINLSTSVNRNSSNGIFLFNRYEDSDNIYYTGLRVDGAVVVKKKIGGKYFTLSYKNYYPGEYSKDTAPNLIPQNTWIGLRSDVMNVANGANIKVYLDPKNDGNWVLVTDVTDLNGMYGERVLSDSGHTGIRADFMDVSFDRYSINAVESTAFANP